MPTKRLSQLEAVELQAIIDGQNRFLTPRWEHLERRGLIRGGKGYAHAKLTDEGEKALQKFLR